MSQHKAGEHNQVNNAITGKGVETGSQNQEEH